MSTPVDTTLTGLKALTAQIKAIIYGARQIPPGPSHYALTSQVTGLVAQVVKDHGDGPLPGIVLLCSKELIIGYDIPRLLRHPWRSQIVSWEELGDDSFDLPVAAPPLTGPIPVDLPSPPVHAGNVTGPSTNPTTEYQDKGKGKAVFPDPEAEAEGSRKRKSPMISEPSSQPLKSAMKSHKCMRSTRAVKSKPFMESEDDDQPMIKPFSGGVPEVVLPRLSTIIVRTPNSPRSPRVPTKQPFGPATAIAGSCLAGVEPPRQTPEAPVQAPPVIDAGAILIPGLNNPCQACNKQGWPCATWLDKRTKAPCMSCVYCMTKKIKCISTTLGSPPKCSRAPSTTRRARSKTPSKAPSKAPPTSQSTARTRSQSRGASGTPGVPAVTTPKTQMRGRSKTITATKAPAPAPAPAPAHKSPNSAVPRAALDVPMPDLHAMAIAIRDGAAHIALLEARVADQDGRIDTLQHLHESLRHEIIDQHPSFPLPNPPANVTTMLLDQSISMSMPPPESALPPLIDLSMAGMAPTPPTPGDASAIEGLMFEDNKVVHPEHPNTSGEHVDPGNPGNLVPEYDSADDMDVEVKVEVSSEETDMAT
ncbi:hypothetical protein EDB19DRAFT_1917578 [Suillus lakei]|nr:hypothetical protein EDB19DRAFT_1917578 [Suillus lakei]